MDKAISKEKKVGKQGVALSQCKALINLNFSFNAHPQ